ncbi:class I SAM-dependent methyltransferase [Winogradskyella immobilis]|uniref:Class I SAM-dependent methyltransferase n=1 Tax=Winogradskyella immobilis TaxID=2816852 RepID=A0ABS8EPU6_9FLAO|nr:class I SAM-dependent methyltransferase [Winogradskyella immobilis]MCC1484901.1 class I SAM-dependent methyltransferase [Winogradskyella immobilis]MCG0016993.1 class I SAM-dependent methyltransferase [Winogradskyella immobilis]
MTKRTITPNKILNLLYTEHPKFHGREEAGSQSYAIKPEVLKWMANNIPTGSNTLETGCGYSTVLLTLLSKKHIVISPFPQEHKLIREWCNSEGVNNDHVKMIAETSQDVVPNLECNDLDFILIDGDHAFPAPFIDWYYTADKLKVGGTLAVDDTHIPTGKILRDFLLKEHTRWSLITDIGTTAFFKRISKENVARDIIWVQQKYCELPKSSLSKRVINKLKRTLRLK